VDGPASWAICVPVGLGWLESNWRWDQVAGGAEAEGDLIDDFLATLLCSVELYLNEIGF
jgi:hypothetical protein